MAISIPNILRCVYVALLGVLAVMAWHFVQPNVALAKVHLGGKFYYLVILLVVSSAIYLPMLAPFAIFGSVRSLILSLSLVGLVAVGPRIVAEYTKIQQIRSVQANDVSGIPFEGDLRVVDHFGQTCAAACKTLLTLGLAQAVRAMSKHDVVEGFVMGPNGPIPTEDVFPPGNLTINLLDVEPYTLKKEWGLVDNGFAKLWGGSQLTITEGPKSDDANARVLFRKTVLSYRVPSVPTVFHAPLDGLTRGGNDGGIVLGLVGKWLTVTSNAEQRAALAAIGLIDGQDRAQPDQ